MTDAKKPTMAELLEIGHDQEGLNPHDQIWLSIAISLRRIADASEQEDELTVQVDIPPPPPLRGGR